MEVLDISAQEIHCYDVVHVRSLITMMDVVREYDFY